jgi:hypothetical protein
MAYQAEKTEHAGAKHGSGAYWGPKREAKKESNKVRRRNGKRTLHEELAEGAPERSRAARSGAEEWFQLDEEVWQRQPVSPTKKAPRAGRQIDPK